MYRRLAPFALFVCLCAYAGLTAHAQTSPAVKVKLQAIYRASDEAQNHKDINKAFAHMDPNMKAYNSAGQVVTFQQLKQKTVQLFRMVHDVSSATTIKQCTVTGNTALVTTNVRLTFTIVNTRRKQVLRYTGNAVSQDTWLHSAGTWRMTTGRVLTETHSATVNGKPIDLNRPRK